MPTLAVTDKLGIALDTNVDRSFSFGKYFSSLRTLSLSRIDFRALGDPFLKDLPLDSLSLGVDLGNAINLNKAGLQLKLGAVGSAGFRLVTSRDPGVFEDDLHGDQLKVRRGAACLGFAINGEASAGLELPAGDASYGFGATGVIRLASYGFFKEKDRFLQALRETLQSYTIVADWEDLKELRENVVAVAEGEGTLRASLRTEVQAVPNPLFAADLPVAGARVSLTAGGKFGAEVTFAMSGQYQVRISRLGPNRIELGYYKAKGKSLEISVESAAGVSAGVGATDLLGPVMGVLSSSAKVDRELLTKNLPRKDIDRIEDLLKEGVQRKVEVNLRMTFGASDRAGEAFVFAIDPSQANAATRNAVNQALHGDLKAITSLNLPGIQLVRSVFSRLKESQHVLRFNLLGIYNYISMSKLILHGQMTVDASGDISVVDNAVAQRAGVSMRHFGSDEQKLRKLLMENFLVSAAYHASRLGGIQPKLRVEHVYFELHSDTKRQALKDNLDVGSALDLLTPSAKQELLRSSPNRFGRSTLSVSAGYDTGLAERLFVKGRSARSLSEYEWAGRQALLRLFEQGDPNDFLRVFAGEDQVWEEMKKGGFRQFSQIFRRRRMSLNNIQLGVLTGYAVGLFDWARAMAEMSKELVSVREWLKRNRGKSLRSKEFQERREQLVARLKRVASKTKSTWSEPWGLVAVYMALSPPERKRVVVQARVHSDELNWMEGRGSSRILTGRRHS